MKEFEPVRVVNCSNCGFPMRQYNPNSIMMVCESCGTRTGDNQQPPAYKPEAPHNPLFKLHEQFDLNGDTWQIIGCQTYSGVVKEWDDEDNAWEHTPWSYITWWVLNEAREIAWIVQDKSGYSWSRKVTIKSGIPEGDTSYEVGSWSLTNTVGELSYYPLEGEQVTSYERDGWSMEILLDEQGNNREIEAFQAEPIKPMDLLIGFGKADIMARIKRAKLATNAAFASAFVIALGYGMLQFFEQTVLTIPSTQITQTMINTPIPIGSMSLGKDSLMQFDVSSRIERRDGSFDANIVVMDNDKAEVAEIPLSMWQESGRDSDGNWTESQSGNAPKIMLPAGNNYQLTLVPEAFTSWSTITVNGKVVRNASSLTPVVIGGLAAILLGLFMLRRRHKVIRRETGVNYA